MGKCGKQTEVFSRVCGYYRPVKNWNYGKKQEFQERKPFITDKEKFALKQSTEKIA